MVRCDSTYSTILLSFALEKTKEITTFLETKNVTSKTTIVLQLSLHSETSSCPNNFGRIKLGGFDFLLTIFLDFIRYNVNFL